MVTIQKHIHVNLSSEADLNNKNKRHMLLTSMRKLFHLLICLVYLIGILFDRNLLFLCSYGMLIVLGLMEVNLFFLN